MNVAVSRLFRKELRDVVLEKVGSRCRLSYKYSSRPVLYL
jgi:hypothetical protein